MSDALEIKRELQSRIGELCAYLLPGGRTRGHEYRCGSIDGGAGMSLGVHLTGSKAGMWAEFNGDGERGDVLALVQAVQRCTFVEALDWARDYLGMERPAFHAIAEKKYKRPERPATVRSLAQKSPVRGYLTEARRLEPATLRAYQIAEGPYQDSRSEHDGEPAIVFPYKRAGELVMVKWLLLERVDRSDARPDGKKLITTTAASEPCLFGWQAIPDTARSVVICEGEADACTWWQMGFPALAPPRGTGSSDWVDVEYPNLERFETIYLAYDNDEAGRKAVAAIVPRFGDRVRVVRHPDLTRYGKDANAWLCAGADRSLFAGLIAGAVEHGPEELRRPSAYTAEVLEEFYPTESTRLGFEPPFGKIAGRVLFRPGELSIWTGYNHHGKSEFLNYLMVSAASAGERICMASLEVLPRNTLARLVRQTTAQRKPEPERIGEALDWLSQSFLIYENSTTVRLQRILEVFDYAARRYGCTQFVLDNLAMLAIAEDDYDGQKRCVSDLVSFALKRKVHAHLVAHPRKAADESDVPGKLDVRGGAALTDLAHNVFAVWKDSKKAARLAELEIDHDPHGEIYDLVTKSPDAIWAVRKQKQTGDVPQIGLWFNRDSLQFAEAPRARSLDYLAIAEQQQRYEPAPDEPERHVQDFDDSPLF